MKQRKLHYRFYNPNSEAVTADYILQIIIEANAAKVEQALQNAANLSCDKDFIKEHSM